MFGLIAAILLAAAPAKAACPDQNTWAYRELGVGASWGSPVDPWIHPATIVTTSFGYTATAPASPPGKKKKRKKKRKKKQRGSR